MITELGQEAITPKFHTGSTVVGVTAVQLISNSVEAYKGVQVLASPSNTDVVYVGSSANVDAGTDPEFNGFPLEAGKGLFLLTNDPKSIYVIADAAAQEAFWLYQ